MTDNRILDALRCPICGEGMALTEDGRSFKCKRIKPHCYDISASGYVNLAPPSQSGGGDSKAAVRARSSFLSAGYYAPVADAICEMIKEYIPADEGIVIDAGCGEGYYSSRIAGNGYAVFGADISKFAAEAAAKRSAREGNGNTLFAVSSVFALPIADGAATAVTNIFAPCVPEEYSRVLKSGGYLLVAYAGEEHLMGLKRAIYDDPYANDGRADMPDNMRLAAEKRVRFEITLDNTEDILALFSMTPYYWRTSPKDAEKLTLLKKLDTTVDIVLALYQK